MSDTHNLETSEFNPDDCPLANRLPKVDVLLHCGDLTQVGGLSAYKKALRLISLYDAEVSIGFLLLFEAALAAASAMLRFSMVRQRLDLHCCCWYEHLLSLRPRKCC